jgi:hypothetical protein
MCHYDRATHVAYDTLATIPYQASSSAPRLVCMQLLLFGPSNALATPSLIRTHTIWGVPRDLEQRSHHSRVLRSNWYRHDPPWRWGTQSSPNLISRPSELSTMKFITECPMWPHEKQKNGTFSYLRIIGIGSLPWSLTIIWGCEAFPKGIQLESSDIQDTFYPFWWTCPAVLLTP